MSDTRLSYEFVPRFEKVSDTSWGARYASVLQGDEVSDTRHQP